MRRALALAGVALFAACGIAHPPGARPGAMCEEIGGRCQTADLPCPTGTEWVGHSPCSDRGDACCVGGPVDPYRTDARPAGTDAGQPDITPPASVELTLLDPSFAFCHCHHGVGPGADGTVTLRVRNGRPVAVVVHARLLRLVAVGGDHEVGTIEGEPPGGLRFEGPGIGPATKSIAAATEADLATVAYIDCAEESVRAGSYRAVLDLEIDGESVRMISEPIDVPVIEPWSG